MSSFESEPSPRIKTGRAARLAPVAVGLILAIAAVALIARGYSVHQETQTVRNETARLTKTRARVEARTRAAGATSADISSTLAAVEIAIRKIGASQDAHTRAGDDLSQAADGGIDQFNAGDAAGAKATFRTLVSAASDRYDETLTALVGDVQAAQAALTRADAARAAHP